MKITLDLHTAFGNMAIYASSLSLLFDDGDDNDVWGCFVLDRARLDSNSLCSQE